MGLIENLRKPEYVFRPRQIVTRVRNGTRAPAGSVQVRLPWGLPLTVRPHETIGRLIWTHGVFELSVTEVLWRLVDPGETAVDVGGNIGYMTSVLAARAGVRGRVEVFEPHPEVHADLQRNVQSWAPQASRIAHVVAWQAAVGATAGTALLSIAESFEGNRGLARITEPQSVAERTIAVPVRRLDEVLDTAVPIGVMKIDVEGYELSVLVGAQAILEQGGVRDIVFEEHGTYPSAVTDYLEALGYTVFALHQRFWGPRACAPRESAPELRVFDTQNFLATLSPERARARLARRGWYSLRGTQAR